MVRVFGDIYGKGVVWSVGFVLCPRAPLQMYLFGTVKDHGAPRAISKMMRCYVCGKKAFTQFLWLNRLLSFGAILGGAKTWDVLGILAAKAAPARSASTAPFHHDPTLGTE